MNATFDEYRAFERVLHRYWEGLIFASTVIKRVTRRGTGAFTNRVEVAEQLFDVHTSLVGSRRSIAALLPDNFPGDSTLSSDYFRNFAKRAKAVERSLREALTSRTKMSEMREIALSIRDDIERLKWSTKTIEEQATLLREAIKKNERKR